LTEKDLTHPVFQQVRQELRSEVHEVRELGRLAEMLSALQFAFVFEDMALGGEVNDAIANLLEG
jgi:hypothetical protein